MVPPQPPPASASPPMTKIQQISRECSRSSTARRKPAALGLPAEEQPAIHGDPPRAGEQQHERGAQEQEVKVEWPVAAGAVMQARNHNKAAQKAREQQPAQPREQPQHDRG